MPALKMPAALRSYVDGLEEAPMAGALEDLLAQFPALRPNLVCGDGANRCDLQGMQTPLGEEEARWLVPSIADG